MSDRTCPPIEHAGEPVGLNYRRRKSLGKGTWLNLSGSGASVSKRFGPLTVNSRGRVSLRLPGGLNWRGRWR
nr:DUF4236 domain-containing protein [Corynebacterium antarcticum]